MSKEPGAELVQFVRSIYGTKDFIPLHAPTLGDIEKRALTDVIDSNFVSSVGAQVDQFEQQIEEYTQSKRAVATVNGTAALHSCLHFLGVTHTDLVITQALTFVATCNAISQLGAEPVFVDVSRDTLGMCEHSLAQFLSSECFRGDAGQCMHRETNKIVKAVVPMHTFGHPVRIDAIVNVAKEYGLAVVEDAAESLGSFYKKQHTGTFGQFGTLSFNGNKLITTGGGGMIMCQRESDAQSLLHLTTTAKTPHPYQFFHDRPAFNYRMPNLNAALGVAQFSRIKNFLQLKRCLAHAYRMYFEASDYAFVVEPPDCVSNFWLNAVHCPDAATRDHLLEVTNIQGVMTRPVWALMNRLPAYCGSVHTDLHNSLWAESTLINLPSTPVAVQ